MNETTPSDLTKHAPRSPRVRLGDFAHLPRLIDKGRAKLSDTLGVYVYGEDSLLDVEFFNFTGLSPDELLQKISKSEGDLEILKWVLDNSERTLLAYDIQAWSQWIENVPGLSTEARAWFAEFSSSLSTPRPDVSTLFEYLDLDDYVRFGGHA